MRLPLVLAAALLAAGAALAQQQGNPNQPPVLTDGEGGGPINGCGDRVCTTDQIQTPLEQPPEPPPGMVIPPNLSVPPPPPDAEAERSAGALPITGSGNGDLWTPPEEPKR